MAITTNGWSDVSQAEHLAWSLLLAAKALLDQQKDAAGHALQLNTLTGQVVVEQYGAESADLSLDMQGRWIVGEHLHETTVQWLEFYLPVLGAPGDSARVIAHLGQSVDARIATTEGDAFFVTGAENRRHLHRLRALCHAVIVGAETVLIDNPQLTTRDVQGASPIRVVIDPSARLLSSNRIFNDAAAPTLLIHDQAIDVDSGNEANNYKKHVDFLPLPFDEQGLPTARIIQALADRGVSRVFVEGGGNTVSRFMREGSLDRLQIATAPLLVGMGRDALQLPGIDSMADAMRPPCKLYRMGDDVLWDFDVSAHAVKRSKQIVRCDVTDPAATSEFELISGE